MEYKLMFKLIHMKLSLLFTGKVRLVFTNGQVYHLKKGDQYFYANGWNKLEIEKVNP